MNNNGIITAPISLKDDVYHVLGASPSGAYYDLGYACRNTHGKINKWSYYKPTPYPSLSLTTQAQMKEAFSSVNYGLTWTKFGTALNLISTVDAGTETWGYQPPTGGSSSPYRLTDFFGYNHRAVSPFSIGWSANGETGVDSVSIGIEYNPIDTFMPAGISSYFWAITFKKPDGTYLTKISDYNVGTESVHGFSVSVNKSMLGVGTTTCYAYLVPSNEYNSIDYNENNLHTYDWTNRGYIIPFPTENNGMEVSYTTADVLVWTLTKNSSSSTHINWTLTISNPTSSAVTVEEYREEGGYTLSAIYPYYGGQEEIDYSGAIGTRTIAANSNYSITRSGGIDESLQFQQTATVYVYYRINGEEFSKELSI